jgi:ABC-2 type transport system ATP-binding protein
MIKTENLTKYYGKNRGIENLNLEILDNEVFGYLGPNGAGKTTTIRLFLDLIKPTRGKVEIFGKKVDKNFWNIKSRIGYLPGELHLYENLTGKEFLEFITCLRRNVNKKKMKDLIDRFNVDIFKPIRDLSQGNKQKIGLIQAFIHDPDLIILDEPTLGLDPFMQEEFYKLITEEKKNGKTFFISSHILHEVEKICDRVGIIKDGKLIALEAVKDLREKTVREIDIYFTEPVSLELFSNIQQIKDLKLQGNIVKIYFTGRIDPIIKRISNFEVENIVTHEPTLEEIFFKLYKGDKDA